MPVATSDRMMGLGWQLHVVPVDDRRRHETDLGCWCGPSVEDGMIVHNAADRREFDEEPQLPLVKRGL